jgi:hypothetical protein
MSDSIMIEVDGPKLTLRIRTKFDINDGRWYAKLYSVGSDNCGFMINGLKEDSLTEHQTTWEHSRIVGNGRKGLRAKRQTACTKPVLAVRAIQYRMPLMQTHGCWPSSFFVWAFQGEQAKNLGLCDGPGEAVSEIEGNLWETCWGAMMFRG